MSNENELTVRRIFDTPRERVWEAWVNPAQVGEWWGPDGFIIRAHEIDVKQGGTWRFVMYDSDGVNYENDLV